MDITIRFLTLLLSLVLSINAYATVPVMRYPSGTPVNVCQPSDGDVHCGSGTGGSFIATDGSSTTTAAIPFAQGITATQTPSGGTGSATVIDITAPLGSTVFGLRLEGYYSDGIRLDGEYKTTDVSISNLFGYNDNSIWSPTATALTAWSVGAAPILYGSNNANFLYGVIAAPNTRPSVLTYSGTLTELDLFESQLLWGSGTATTINLFHGKNVGIGGTVTNFNGLKIEDITGATTNRSILTGAGQVELGDNLIWTTTNTKDIGAAAANKPRTGYFGTNVSSPIFTSTVAIGTAPLTVTSTTKVTNLNSDLLDDKNTGTSGNVVPLMDGTNTFSGSQVFSVDQSGAMTGFGVKANRVGQGGINYFDYEDGSNQVVTIPAVGNFTLVTANVGSNNDWQNVNTFLTNSFKLYNPAVTFAVSVNAGAQIANRTWTFPVGSNGTFAATNLAQTFSATQTITGDLKLGTAGNGLYVKEGSNATMGVATLVGGTVVVSTTKVTANSRIFLTAQSLGTVTIGQGLAVSARTAGTSFTILSQSAIDTSAVAWLIMEPA